MAGKHLDVAKRRFDVVIPREDVESRVVGLEQRHRRLGEKLAVALGMVAQRCLVERVVGRHSDLLARRGFSGPPAPPRYNMAQAAPGENGSLGGRSRGSGELPRSLTLVLLIAISYTSTMPSPRPVDNAFTRARQRLLIARQLNDIGKDVSAAGGGGAAPHADKTKLSFYINRMKFSRVAIGGNSRQCRGGVEAARRRAGGYGVALTGPNEARMLPNVADMRRPTDHAVRELRHR
jgi:hypothetical protein